MEAVQKQAAAPREADPGRNRGTDRGWIPELDGLRVLMVFLVSWYHIWQQSWLTPYIGSYSMDYLMRSGYVWVDGTVLLSSFLLFLPYAKAARAGQPLPDVKDFYFRRARRVLPAYYFILALTLFGLALPWHFYYTPQHMVKDVATHLTFTFTLFRDTYLGSQLGGACWTLAIEVQAYVLFPLIARAALKKPWATLLTMTGIAWGFRLWCVWSLPEYDMVVNQLINFLDVYALGIALAAGYVLLKEKNFSGRSRIALTAGATILFLGAMWALAQLLRIQASANEYNYGKGLAGMISTWLQSPGTNGHSVLQRNQMLHRPFFALCFGALILSAPFTVLPLRKLLGNPVTHFLSGISMNYYLTHHTVIVHMKRLGFPASEYELPNQVGDKPWQYQYTFWAFGLSLAVAILITYLVEKPAARLINRLREKRRAKQSEQQAAGEAIKA